MDVPTTSRTSARHLSVDADDRDLRQRRRAGGVAALYLALALLAAIPYFLLVVDYPGAETAAEKVALVVENYASLYPVYLASYVLFGIAVGVLALALHDELRGSAAFPVRIATLTGLLWSFALVASGMVFTYGMTAIEALAATDRAQAVVTWQAVETVALALGGAGGEVLGGLWILLVSLLALRGRGYPTALGWLGVVVGVVGLASVVPPLHDLAVAFGLLQIPWLVWLGLVLLRPSPGGRS
jgi:hypothetical protein